MSVLAYVFVFVFGALIGGGLRRHPKRKSPKIISSSFFNLIKEIQKN